jgi:hypothetical protein
MFDGVEGWHQVVPRDALRYDGQWHVLAVDVWATGVTGAIRGLAVQAQASDKVPAQLSLDFIRHADEAPPGADVYPRQVPAALDWRAEPTWLANPDDQARLLEEAGALAMVVSTPGKGMKWSRAYGKPVDLTPARYVAVRYRARNVAPHGDYFVYAAGTGPDGKARNTNLVNLESILDDGAWIDWVRFTSRPPLVSIADAFAHTPGYDGATLAGGKLQPIDLSAAAQATAKPLLRALSLADWFAGPRFTVEGVPFELPAGGSVLATSRDKIEPIWAPVGRGAREFFLLLAVIPPEEDYSGMLGPRPLGRFSDPERFVARVRYADGVKEEQFPVRVRTGAYEMTAGIDLYALPELRGAAVERIGLESRMGSGVVLLAGLTLNAGEPRVRPPAIAVLPPESNPAPWPRSSSIPG